MSDFIPYGRQSVDEDDVAAVAEVLRGDWLTTGPHVERFERALGEIAGGRHAVAVNSGTAALHAAYEAAGVGPGAQVIVPPLTFSATANAALYLGADVVFADISPDTLTIDPGAVETALTDRTKVVTAVDYAGHPADYDRLRAICKARGVTLVADACHSIGGAYRGAPVGSVADLTCFSFHPVKTVTTGEGGAVVTDDDALASRMREFRSHGMERGRLGDEIDPGPWAYDISTLGYNYRITDFQCALGLSQLAKLERFVRRRQELAARYRELLGEVADVELPPDASWCSHGYHLFPIRVPAARRREIFEGLRARGIGVQVHYIPVNMLEVYRDRGHHPEETPVALDTYQREISMPLFPQLTDDDVERVVAVLIDLL